MLIDELLSNPIISKAGMLTSDLRGRLSKATKFVLQRDFAIAADEFSSDLSNVDKVLALARLPYPECWFEVAQEDRKLFAQAPMGENDSKCARIGFLCTQHNNTGSWSAHLFWSFAAGETMLGVHLPPSSSGYKLIVDPQQSGLIKATSFHPADGIASYFRRFATMDDWIGEPGFIVATLALLSSRNAVETQPVEVNNKRRKLTGKPLLFSYHLLSIPQRYRQRHLPTAAADDPMQLRAHFVRGHFKVRKTGVYFWSEYQRGNPTLGFVHKDYQLRRPRIVGAAA